MPRSLLARLRIVAEMIKFEQDSRKISKDCWLESAAQIGVRQECAGACSIGYCAG